MKLKSQNLRPSIDQINNLIDTFQLEIKKHKKLSPDNFSLLTFICKTPHLINLLSLPLNSKETNVVGHAIMKAKKLDCNFVISQLNELNPRNSFLMTCVLLKRGKINVKPVFEFILNTISNKIVAYLNLALVFSRNYKEFCTEEFVEKVKLINHPICEEILDVLGINK